MTFRHPLAAMATRMSAGYQCFAELAQEIFLDYGQDFDYDRLNQTDRRRLCAAYLRDDPSVLDDVLAGIKNETIAGHIADLMAHRSCAEALDKCDAVDLAAAIWSGTFPNKELAALVEGELDRQWHLHLKFRNQEAADERAEAARHYGTINRRMT